MDLLAAPQPLRFLFYSHDSYGLGHLRRTLTLSRHLRARWPGSSQLIVTGSPLAHELVLPGDVDYVKLPSVVKVGAGRYQARSLPLPLEEIRDLRAEMLQSAAAHYRPNVVIVDHAPAGLAGEMVPTLRRLKRESPRTRLVLGLRDVVDEATAVRRDWWQQGIYELLDEVYDLVLVYGQRTLYDVVREYRLSKRAAAKTRYVGYLRREAGSRAPEDLRADLGLRTGRLVLATAGGGGDGEHVLQALLDGMRMRPAVPFDTFVVPGPLMDPQARRRLERRIPRGARVGFADFVEDLGGYVAAADAVVSMGGYNAVCEILSFARPAVIVPRVAPRKEQLIRAELLSRRGVVRMIHPGELTPRRLLDDVNALLREPCATPAVELDGLPAVAEALEAVLA
jgi:predicted glycosyltransferase